ncbi:MAG: hypothetical protein K5945_01730 [Bacteroidaceae bacterium]|nr:hypothetical protein [Bacteroidaceae bacterium]
MTCSRTVAADDLKAIKRNYRNVLLNPTDPTDPLFVDWIEFQKERGVDVKATFDVEAIEAYLARQNEDGSWTDVDYNDKQRSAWSPSIHCSRIEELARLYYKGPKGYRHSKRIKKAVHRAMDYWFTTKPVCTNWWFNEIGAPKILGEASVILEEQLSKSELEGAVEVLNHSRFKQTGQNKVWQAGNVLMRAMLQGDRELVRAARDTIASEIVLGHREGIKPDWSFHQHGPQQQFGNYGLSFVNIMASYYRIFNGTSSAFSPEQTNILTSLLDRGYRWAVWKRFMDVASLGRQVIPDAPVKGHIALIDIQHGEKPRNAQYEYIVLPTATKEKVGRFDVNSIQVFQNDQTAQIVGVEGTDEYWLSVFRPGTFRIEGASVNIDKAGVYHLRKADNGLQVLKSNPFRITK